MEKSCDKTEAKEESDKCFEGPFIPVRVESKVLVALHRRDSCKWETAFSQEWVASTGITEPVANKLTDFPTKAGPCRYNLKRASTKEKRQAAGKRRDD